MELVHLVGFIRKKSELNIYINCSFILFFKGLTDFYYLHLYKLV